MDTRDLIVALDNILQEARTNSVGAQQRVAAGLAAIARQLAAEEAERNRRLVERGKARRSA